MSPIQEIRSKAIDVRKKLRALALDDEATPEQRSEMDALSGELDTLETREAALIRAGEEEAAPVVEADDAEGRELRSLLQDANMGHFVHAAIEQRSVDGRELELQQHYRLAAHELPIDMLCMERRAVTPAPSNVGTSQQEILQPVFATGAADYLSIPRPRVPVGDVAYPVLTTRPSVGGPDKASTSVNETTGAFAANLLDPEEIRASFFYRRVDRARFAMMDEALRQALSSGLQEKHDYEILRGTRGLLSADDGSSNPVLANVDTSTTDTYQTYVSRLGYGRVDGRFAMSLTDIRILLGSATYAHMGATYTTPVYDNAANVLSNQLGGMRVSAHIPAVASNKQPVIVRRGMLRDAVSPVWSNVGLIINDEVTQAAKGEIKITAIAMFNMKVLRADGFAKVQAKVS